MMPTDTILFATGNVNKFAHITKAIGAIDGIAFDMRKPSGHEIQSSSIKEVCLHKARAAFEQFGQPVFVHDVGMNLPELGGFPGAYLKDFTRIPLEKLQRMFKQFDDRRILFEDWLIFIDGEGQAHEFMHDTGGALILSQRLGSGHTAFHPMNALIAFASAPMVPGSENPAFFDQYDNELQQHGIVPCWVKFRDFLTRTHTHG